MPLVPRLASAWVVPASAAGSRPLLMCYCRASAATAAASSSPTQAELGPSVATGAKLRGSWASFLRAAAGHFLALVKVMTERAEKQHDGHLERGQRAEEKRTVSPAEKAMVPAESNAKIGDEV